MGIDVISGNRSMEKKQFIDEELAGYIVEEIGRGIPELKKGFAKHKHRAKDMIRFQPISEMCRHEREKKARTIKDVSGDLGIPQYRIKYVEEVSVENIHPDILEKYVDYLGFRKWFNSWKKCNMDVYERLSVKG